MTDPSAYDAEIKRLVVAARALNLDEGITGGLVFANNCFAQVLEGPKKAVEHRFSRIRVDTRHQDVTLLQAKYIPQRTFLNWAMGYAVAGRETRDAGAIIQHALEIPDDVTAAEIRKLIEKCIRNADIESP